MQKAEELKLDRSQKCYKVLNFAKKADAGAKRPFNILVGKRVEPSAADVDKYYNEHPYLFENRQLYDIAVFLLKASDMTDAANAAIEISLKVNKHSRFFRKEDIKFKQTEAKRAAEEIPPVVLEKLVMINIGDIIESA